MARGEAENLMARLRKMSEDGLTSFFSEVMANDGMRKAIGSAGERFLNNKGRFDRNIETLLDFMNIPSKRDVRELKARLDHVNGQLVNLNMKLDRLLAHSGKPPVPPRPRKRPAPIEPPSET